MKLNPVSDKREIQLREEAKLKRILLSRSNGRCEKCHGLPDTLRGLVKHEIKSRAQGGDPLDPKNCIMLCGACHTWETFDVVEKDAKPMWSKRV